MTDNFVSFGSVSSVLFTLGVAAFIKKFNLVYLAVHKVDRLSKNNGGQLVAQVLQAHGVKHIFTLVGGHISPILAAAEKLGIRVVDTRHEATAVFAADAVARLSGTVGVAAVTAGPGVTNTITAIKNAQMAESPLLLLGGAAATMLKGRGALQDIDQLSLFRPICKFTTTVSTVRDIVPQVRRAIQVAQSGIPGPVFVELPIDTLYPFDIVAKESAVPPSKNFIVNWITSWYVNNYLSNLFAGAWEKTDVSPLKASVPQPSKSQIKQCADLMRKSKKPLILVGSQATLPPVPAEEVKTILERIGVPCYVGGMSRGLLGKTNKILIRQQRKDALKQSDCVVLAGTICDFRLSYGRILPKRASIISVNRGLRNIWKNAFLFWKPTVAVNSDVGTFLKLLSEELGDKYSCDPNWIKSLSAVDTEKEAKNESMANMPTSKHLNPIKVLFELEKVLPENAILVADGGDFVATAAYVLRPRGPLKWLDPGPFGTLGVGGGFALGAKLCRPDCEVWIIYGDGSSGYSIAEMDTFTRHKTPVLALIGNDACWMQIEREQIPMLGSDVACKLAYCDYDVVSKGYGAKGHLIKKEDEGKLGEIFKEAQKENAEGHSVTLNVLIGTTDFRQGSISV